MMDATIRLALFPPGSDVARAAGCICPVADNGHGRGVYVDEQGQPHFWTIAGCPVHDVDGAA